MGVRFSYGLEPDSRACRFEAHQAERRVRVKLPEIARQSDLQGFDLLRNPTAHLAQPSWFRKWAFPATFAVPGEYPEGIQNPAGVFRMPEGRNRQRGSGNPGCCSRE